MIKPVVQQGSLITHSSRLSVVVVGLISVFLTFAIWGAFYFGFLREKWKLKQSISRHWAQKQNILAHLKNAGQGSLADIHANALNPEQAIPNTVDISDLLDAVSNEAEQAGMMLMNFEEGKEEASGLLVEIPIEVTLTGQYENLVQFIESLNRLPRLMTIKKMHLTVFSSTDNSVTLYVTFVLAAYRGKTS